MKIYKRGKNGAEINDGIENSPKVFYYFRNIFKRKKGYTKRQMYLDLFQFLAVIWAFKSEVLR